MTDIRLLDKVAKAVRSLVLLFQSNYVRFDPRMAAFHKVRSEINQNLFHIFFFCLLLSSCNSTRFLGFMLLELCNSHTTLAAEDFIIFCNNRNVLTRILNKI